MGASYGRVHTEVDDIMSQSPQDSGSGSGDEEGVDFTVVIVRTDTHYVRAINSDDAIRLALSRPPDQEAAEVRVVEAETEEVGE